MLLFVPRVRQPASLGESGYLLEILNGAAEEAEFLGHRCHLVTRESVHRLGEPWDLAVGVVQPLDPWIPRWRLLAQKIPCVHLMTHPQVLGQPDVALDDDLAMKDLVSHLVDAGAKDLQFLSVTLSDYGQRRGRSFLKACKERGLRGVAWGLDAHGNLAKGHRPMTVALEKTFATFAAFATRRLTAWWDLTPRPPHGLLCETDKLAALALDFLRQQGLHVPGEMLLTGFNDFRHTLTAEGDFPVTSYRQDLSRMARLAVHRAHRALVSRRSILDMAPTRVPGILVPRASTNPLRPKNPHDGMFLHRVQRLLEEYLDRPEAPSLVAEAMDLSKPYLLRRYARDSGISLTRALADLRLEQAGQLLAESRMTIGEVAHQCGFRSLQVFARVFRSRHKTSPRAFREMAARGPFLP